MLFKHKRLLFFAATPAAALRAVLTKHQAEGRSRAS
jgi:hypothetical protein